MGNSSRTRILQVQESEVFEREGNSEVGLWGGIMGTLGELDQSHSSVWWVLRRGQEQAWRSRLWSQHTESRGRGAVVGSHPHCIVSSKPVWATWDPGKRKWGLDFVEKRIRELEQKLNGGKAARPRKHSASKWKKVIASIARVIITIFI